MTKIVLASKNQGKVKEFKSFFCKNWLIGKFNHKLISILFIICPGIWNGKTAFAAKGDNDFGYNPIFYVPEYTCTAAELSLEMKNKISHCAKALQCFLNQPCNKKIKYNQILT